MNSRAQSKAGIREQHLLRKRHNPLFDASNSDISNEQLARARLEDGAEMDRFLGDFQLLVQKAAQFEPNTPSDTILELKEELDRAYQQACALPGDQEHIKHSIRKLLTVIMQAVRAGGGVNHRMGLYDGILIKENHLALAGANAIEIAIGRARQGAHHLVKVEIEVDCADAAETAARAGADAILLDNMAPAQMRDAVNRVRNVSERIIVEASGSVSLDNVREVAETGVDVISVGKLTHSAPAVDISLEIVGE